MAYTKRLDGRAFNDLRPLKAEVGVIKNAVGSAKFEIGNTIAYAAVYGPRELYPKFLQDPKRGVLRVHYNMLPFSGMGDRVRPGGNRRSKEISLVMKNALLPVLNLTEFPNAVLDVYVEFVQTDAGSRCAGICAASIALAHAGVMMRDLVSAVAVGRVDDKLAVDLDYMEEQYPEFAKEKYEGKGVADMPVSFILQNESVSLLQMDGKMSPEEISESIKLAKEACTKIRTVQKQALINHYSGDSK
jgi:exosome complex component RRP41